MKTSALVTFLFALLSSGAWAQTAFVPGFEDLPLAPGLTVQDEPVAFVTPSGRIIESTTDLTGPSKDVLSFYETTLPQLGWVKQTAQRYHRDGETLVVDILDEAGREYVVFRLTPADSP